MDEEGGSDESQVTPSVEEEEVGEVFTYFSKVEVAGINITNSELKVGDTIHIKGATSDFTQTIDSMEIDRQKVDSAGVGQSIGIKVKERVRPKDKVYRITSSA